MAAPLRFGVVGTGPWATGVHAPAAALSARVEFAAVLGRDAGRADSLVHATTARSFTELAAFLEAVDVVGFAVPPDAQAALAMTAIEAGKHVLLEKPVAVDVTVADGLAEAARVHGIRSLVFFTHRFAPEHVAWTERARAAGPWALGRVESYSSVLVDPSNPFHDSAWRHERGALWDIGPHAVAQLCGVLGRVTGVRAESGPGDLTSILLRHESGAQGSISIAADAPPGVPGGTYLIGPTGRTAPPPLGDWLSVARESYGAALAQLANEIESGAPAHECSLDFGVHVTRVLRAAELSALSGRVETP